MLFKDGDTLSDGWAKRDIIPSDSIGKPKPLFRKLDDSIIEEENTRLIGN
jgi:methionyl-tRNA synthetase